MNRKYPLMLLTALIFAICMGSCKPTEKNYKSAYDKAMEKARQGLSDYEYEQMVLNDLPPYKHTATDSLRVFSESIMWQYSPASVNGGEQVTPARYNLAVGKYSMLTNAKGHADRLSADGWKAVVLRNGEPIYYVVVKMSEDLDTVAAAAHEYVARYPHGVVSLHEPMAVSPLMVRGK